MIAALDTIVIPDEGAEHVIRALALKRDPSEPKLREIGRSLVRAALGRAGLAPQPVAASILPFEGLDVVLNTLVRKTGTTFPDPGYLGLFTSQTPSTVPSQDAILATGAGTSPVTEATGGGYARAAIAGTNWPAGVTNGTGRRSQVVSPGISFAESTGAYAVPAVNGFFLATAATAGVAIFYANFVSGAAINVNQAGFVVRIPPYLQFNGA